MYFDEKNIKVKYRPEKNCFLFKFLSKKRLNKCVKN